MATIKHTSSKNSDLSAAEHYLTFQHNEYTGLPIFDSDGKNKLRENYLLNTLECGGNTFAMACLLANRKYGKNAQAGDVKTHHYIISFDPRDATDNGLTLEKAQTLGLQFCKENFPGHPAIVCAHPDGHNGAGNIHVHIVISSLRIREVERRPHMEKPCDWQEGCKHRCTSAMLRHLRAEVMELCQSAGLYQIDLLKGSGDRITEREYWAQRRGQRRLDYANAKDAASGLPIRQTKYETEKAVLRKNIRSVLRKATSLEDFSAQLLQEHGIALTESRGRFSYRTADRIKPITSRKLGDDFSKERVLAILAENAEHQKTAALHRTDPTPDKVSRLIDIQAKLASGKGAGYERWAKVFNLKQMAKSMALLSEHGVSTEAELAQRIDELQSQYSEVLEVVKDLETRIDENRELSRHVSVYIQNRKFAQQVKTAKKPEAFREQHRAELTAYQAAAAYFKAHNIKKLPSLKQLDAEQETLISEKAQFYQKYREARKAWLDLSTAQQNLEALHRAEGRRETTRGGLDEAADIAH